MNVDVTYPVGTTLKTTDETVKKVESLLAKEKNIDFYQTTIGSAKGSLNTTGKISGSNSGTIFVKLKDTADVRAVVNKLQNEANPLTSDRAKIKVSQMNPNGGTNNNVEVTVTGSKLADIKQATGKLTKQF